MMPTGLYFNVQFIILMLRSGVQAFEPGASNSLLIRMMSLLTLKVLLRSHSNLIRIHMCPSRRVRKRNHYCCSGKGNSVGDPNLLEYSWFKDGELQSTVQTGGTATILVSAAATYHGGKSPQLTVLGLMISL